MLRKSLSSQVPLTADPGTVEPLVNERTVVVDWELPLTATGMTAFWRRIYDDFAKTTSIVPEEKRRAYRMKEDTSNEKQEHFQQLLLYVALTLPAYAWSILLWCAAPASEDKLMMLRNIMAFWDQVRGFAKAMNVCVPHHVSWPIVSDWGYCLRAAPSAEDVLGRADKRFKIVRMM